LREPRWQPVLAGAIVAASLSYLSYWAGVPARGLAAFFIGIAALVGLTLACGAVAWQWLRPGAPTEGSAAGGGLALTTRRLLAALLAIGTLSLTVGGFWDEVWHRKYGLPFGEDLLWRPHLLIYFGLLLPPALAAGSLAFLLRRGQGSVRDRMRSDRSLGLLMVLGAFLFFSVPADPVWHLIYGEDISAWSLPHLVLMLSALMLAILGVYLHLSSSPARREWTGPLPLRATALLSLVFFTGAASIMAQVLIGDFSPGNPMALQRPAWLLPALMVGLALFVGTMANHANRSYGAASAVGLLTLAARYLLVWVFDFRQIDPAAWLPWLPPLVVLDLWYALRIGRSKAPASSTLTAGVALAGAAVSLWLIPGYYTYLHFTGSELVGSLIMVWLVAVAAVWLGRLIGDSLASAAEGTSSAPSRASPRSWTAPAVVLAWLLFVIYFVATSTPPTHTF
jgi:hypothetical protein